MAKPYDLPSMTSMLLPSSIAVSMLPAGKMAALKMMLLMAVAAFGAVALADRPWMQDPKADPEQRAQALLDQMTLDEKILMLHGSSGPYVGNVPANTRLGIPALNLNDGPQGFRPATDLAGTSTAFPSGLTVAATWDKNLTYAWGAAMGTEFWNKGSNVQLGPGVCVARVPVNGRNFEYASGEDPFLGYTIVQPAIKGIQDQGVIANVKHYVQNNQETNRQTVSENVDERTRFEIYYPPFEGAFEAGVGSLMCSYNKINGYWSCENNQTLGTDLRVHLLKGQRLWVMSDWGATHSTSIMQGLDQEMPGGNFMGDTLKSMVVNASIPESAVNQSILNILVPMFSVGLFDRPNNNSITANVTSDAHNAVARELSAASHVLLKNEGDLLPLDRSSVKTIAVIGAQAATNTIVHGGGSGQVYPPYVITPLGLNGPFCNDQQQCIYYSDGSNLTEAAELAAKADVALVAVATTSSEGSDRADLSLGNGQDELVTMVAAHQSNTIVHITCPGAVLTPWREDVKSIFVSFMGGQELGNAMADVIFGEVNPSGRLPLTFPNVENEIGMTTRQYPGLDNGLEAYYDEALLVGYRWYDHHAITPAFPFGHGLSYTSFEYSDIQASKTSVSVTVTNTGSKAGAEVAQLYLGFPSSAGEPPRQLKGFEKVVLAPGAKTTVTFDLRPRDLSIWDVKQHAWSPVSGTFEVAVGASSRDIRQTSSFDN
ncbi:uncharacterized protein MONBRDRAFT_32335 [Monosiga brevicollis MX1]|uniref:Probable beta-glucosidase G n=1 Tax=Monosiga brevicollis TaxID=81824 RepID=A9UYV6_MONBE|nr:uncharacterized protein MONBRDRAFT_32335 [Monosiga brevicollis MX1]EDQ89527.1 predicted protein [Monosiga brevicollis MX1]|eukprot:XP_001745556.1 hypothetical protein [Monosiga brevicollis MX1]